MAFDVNTIKENIRDTLRTYLYPQNLEGTVEVKLSDTINYEVAQSFKTYSKCYSKVSPYRYTLNVYLQASKTGTPSGGLQVSLTNDSNDIPSSTLYTSTIPAASIGTSASTVLTKYTLSTYLGSNTKYWLKVTPLNTVSTLNYFSVYRTSTDEYLPGSLKIYSSSWDTTDGDLYFKADIPNFLYTDYPRSDISMFSFPRMAVDVIGRRVNQKWISKELSEYYLDLTIVAYSRFPEELDDLLSFTDRALFRNRTNVGSIKRIDPAAMTPVSVIREDLLSRGIRYSLIWKMSTI